MFTIDADKTIHITRGDIAVIEIGSVTPDKETHIFQPGDVIRLRVYVRKNHDNVVLMKEVIVDSESPTVDIYLEKSDTMWVDTSDDNEESPGGNSDAPSGGGDKWELIADVTAETDVTKLQITEDLNGNAFSLKKAHIIIDSHPALLEGSSNNVMLAINFTKDHVWTYSFARYSTPQTEGEHGLRVLTVSVAEDGRIIPLDHLVSINTTTMPTGMVHNTTPSHFILYEVEETNGRYVSNETWIDVIQIGSYIQGVGKGTRIMVYGVRA